MKPYRKPRHRMVKALMALTFLECFACKSTQTSQPLHDAGRYQNDVSAFQWQTSAEQEFITYALAPRIGAVRTRPAGDPLRQRLQFWLDQLDLYLREKDRAAMKGVPKPQALLLENAAPNAFVASMEVCLNKASQLQGAEGASEDFLGVDRELGGIFSVPGPRPCVKIPYQGAELQRFMDWYLKPFPGCQARVTARAVDLTGGCIKASVDGANTPAQTREIFVRLSGNWVVVTTGLIQNLSEYEAVYTLFHEAAHYYMAHLSNSNALYDFFYGLGTENPASKPIADPKVQALGQDLLYWLKAKETGTRSLAEGAPGQRYHSGLYVLARNVIQDWIRKEGTRSACKDLSQHFLNAPGLARFPLEKPDARGQQSYRLYEDKVDACLTGMPLDPELQARMIGFTRFVAPWSSKVLVSVPGFATVKELWNWLNASLPAVIAAPQTRIGELSRQADAVGLGQYTSEQEADELTIEWLAKFGIDPNHGITAALKLLKLESEFPPLTSSIGAYTYDQCVRAYESKFRGADGREQRVPVGDYSDPHHSSCFRAFNMNREIDTHQYMSSLPPPRVPLPTPAWDAIAR
ncbi:MAG TPA: hypothetical protein VFO10_09690 [Oligoflexus sp.]|uniref:hypothetical protein n=1 Tax=Oligoflexus sp. TaxID=1971216 RepID=UPI002D7FFF8C|nr:hypothetical protein [Oligoflexus sp.]HET9237511.1 hypothetical protein [Oligoflexus sp.]